MVIVNIIGGLGNQLFQYAAARSLALLKHTEVKLDITGFEEYQLRHFDLSQLSLDFTIASPAEIEAYKAVNRWQRIQSYVTPYHKRKFYKQPFFHFDPRFHQLGRNVYLKGFFQSEKYFAPVKETIRKEFHFQDAVIQEVKTLASELKEQCSVALHIRRGDYKNEETLRYHGILPLAYYEQAIAYMKTKLAHPHFYIFTDDGDWVKKNLLMDSATIVSGIHSHSHFEDLYLMSCCQHNIIASSSFSWWGAWLNEHADKIVIAPRQWFNEGPKDTQDLYATNWVIL